MRAYLLLLAIIAATGCRLHAEVVTWALTGKVTQIYQYNTGGASGVPSSTFSIGRPYTLILSYDTSAKAGGPGVPVSGSPLVDRYLTGSAIFNYDNGRYVGTASSVGYEVFNNSTAGDYFRVFQFVVASGFGPVNGQNFDGFSTYFLELQNLSGAAFPSTALPANLKLLDFAGGNNFIALRYGNGNLNVAFDITSIAPATAPVITAHPAGRSYNVGDALTLSAAVSATPAATWQWYKDGVAIPDATSATLDLGVATGKMAGSYYAVATNDLGSARTNSAAVTVAPSPFAGYYSGKLSTGDAWAMDVDRDGLASFVATLVDRGQIVLAQNVIVAQTGLFTFGTSSRPAEALDRQYHGEVSGTVASFGVTGQLPDLHVTFAGTMNAAANSSPALEGLYDGVTVGGAFGELHALVAGDGTMLLVAVDPTGVRGGVVRATSSGAFVLNQPGFVCNGTVDPASHALTGTLQSGTSASRPIIGRPTNTASDRLINVSCRGLETSGPGSIIVGFAVGGSGSRDVLVRGVGPALRSFGVSDALASPRLDLYQGSVLLQQNAGWSSNPLAAQIKSTSAAVGAFPLPDGSADSAVLVRVSPGAYTVPLASTGPASGIVLAEVYDAGAGTGTAKILNLSARGMVGTGDDALFIGFVVTGSAPRQLLIRGVGAELQRFGLSNTLADPVLELFTANQQITASNDNWSDGTSGAHAASAAASSGAFPLTLGSKDAALVATLGPGNYYVRLRGANNGTGLGLIELYEVAW